MARTIDVRDPTPASLKECIEELNAWGFEPAEEISLSHAANWLKRLGNNPDFLGDVLVAMLKGRGQAASRTPMPQGIGPNRVVLARPKRGNFILTADFWPAQDDYTYRASGSQALGYGFVHNHNADFLTLGYFGPGYSVENYSCEPEALSGWIGEPVLLRPLGRSCLERGQVVHYRPWRDVRCLYPPAALSVSLTLMHVNGGRSWDSYYVFERVAGSSAGFRVAKELGHGSSETFLRLAVALGGDEAADLACDFGRRHPSDRMRLTAWRALAGAAPDAEARDAIWREAEMAGSRAVAEVARRERA